MGQRAFAQNIVSKTQGAWIGVKRIFCPSAPCSRSILEKSHSTRVLSIVFSRVKVYASTGRCGSWFCGDLFVCVARRLRRKQPPAQSHPTLRASCFARGSGWKEPPRKNEETVVITVLLSSAAAPGRGSAASVDKLPAAPAFLRR